MKAEERKALETNVLVDRLSKAYEGIKHGPSRSTVFYGVLLLLALLVVVAIRYFMRDSDRLASERWTKLDAATFPAQIDDLAEDKDLKNTPQGRLARYMQARAALAEGLRDLGSWRDRALERIKTATETYEDLLKSSSERVPLLRQEALWGAAVGNETLATSESLEKARAYYEKLAKEYPESELGKEARRQIERLDSESTQRELKALRELTEGPGKSR